MSAVPETLSAPWAALDAALAELDAKRRCAARAPAGRPYLALRLALAGRSSVLVAPETKAEVLAEDFKALQALFPELNDWAAGFLPEKFSRERVVRLEEARQARGLTWFASPESLREKTFSKTEFGEQRLVLKVGKLAAYDKVVGGLAEHGYQRVGFVEDVGEFAVRGEVLDFWSPNYAKPVRLIFSEDVIESMHLFEPDTQRTISFVPETAAIPLTEARAGGSLAEHLPPGAVLLLDALALDPERKPRLDGFPEMELGGAGLDLGLEPTVPTRLNWKLFKDALQKNARAGTRSIVFCRNVGESQRLEDILDELRCREERPQIVNAPLIQGWAALKFFAWTFAELVGASPVVSRLPKFKMGRAFENIAELRPGDYVVHEIHGIGRYRGLERVNLKLSGKSLRAREKESEFLSLEYRGGDRLLVPIQDFRLIQKYIGAEAKKPKLYSLDGAAWERMKQRVRKEVEDIAQELLETAAARAVASRPAELDPADEHLYREFSDAFPYEETQDQLAAIRAVEADLQSPRLMDRLICGDVGYGKTEVAMRAAFRIVCQEKQVAVLVPTTILAEQHYKTFSDRFAAFPVKIEMISRFQDPARQRRILADAAAGRIDVLIGTHRLLQPDIKFPRLGMIVIDEEHRFGVKQKEKLKAMRVNADLLTLSATPIPRTLALSMGGVRDVSIIETPPQGRLPIETFVGPFNEEKLEEAIQRETARGGQVFYVYNRISTIEKRKKNLEKAFPKLKIGVAHGQMDSDSLEKAMWQFLHRQWDILLATTIIESGLDIPNVNTLVVEDSDEFGLAQLYQLRGRVGRQREKAYCYLFFSQWGGLSEDARKRLSAIQEFSALGSGMKLALRDMEIRGTGNVLGQQQHGWIAAVGLDLYCQMLASEVRRLREERGIQRISDQEQRERERQGEVRFPEIELDVAAFIPDQYVEAPGERIVLYKKMADCRNESDVDALLSELQDRFGPPPEPVMALFTVLRLKLLAYRAGLASVVETESGVVFCWSVAAVGLPIDVAGLAGAHPDLIEITPIETAPGSPNQLRVLFKSGEGGDVFKNVEKWLQISMEYVTMGTPI